MRPAPAWPSPEPFGSSAPPPAAAAIAPPASLAAEARARPWWRYPATGAAIGAVALGAYGLYYDVTCGRRDDDWFCGYYTLIAAAEGAVLGAAVGAVVHLVRR